MLSVRSPSLCAIEEFDSYSKMLLNDSSGQTKHYVCIPGGEKRKAQKAILNAMDGCYPLTNELNRKVKKVRLGQVSMIPASEPK